MAQTKAQLIDGKGAVDLGALSISGSAPDNSVNLDSSGRLLVGTSSVNNNIRVQQKVAIVDTGTGTIGGVSITSYPGTNLTARSIIDFQRSRGTTDGSLTTVANGDMLGSIIFRGADGTQFIDSAIISGEVDGTPGANDMPGRLVFFTTADGASSATERMRIHSDGAVTIGKTGNSQIGNGFFIVGAGLAANGATTSTISSGVNTYHVYSSSSSTYRFYVNENGGISNFSGNNVNLSDEREKKNIENLESTWDCLKHWELKKFNYNEEHDDAPQRYGVIAQQVAPHCPEVISEWKKDDGPEGPVLRMGVKEQQMYWMAIKALQEAQVRIETLEAEVAALKVQ